MSTSIIVTKAEAELAVATLLDYIGVPIDNGTTDTPARVVRAFAEMTAGYDVDVPALLERTFDDHCDEMIVVSDIEFTSLCEHHLLPFMGTADVCYIPQDGKVVGLSKIPRLVDAFAKRLQLQERLTRQIAEALVEHLDPLGVGVVITAKHLCMSCRGVRKPGAAMTTSAMLGKLRESDVVRHEFLALR